MFNIIDRFLNAITMYKLVLYCLAVTAAIAVLLAYMGFISFQGWQLLNSAVFFVIFCSLINYGFAKLLKAPATLESPLITGLILFFIMQPIGSLQDLFMVFLVSFVAMASKYVVAVHRRHIFNPAAFGAVIFAFFNNPATWWVASPYLFPLVLISALLIVRKIKRFPLVLSCLFGFFVTYFFFAGSSDIISTITSAFISWPILFFASIMLTEPSTMIAGREKRLMYGFVIGLFLGHPFQVIGNFYTTPENILIIGNLVAFAFSLKGKMAMRLEEKVQINKDSYEFRFKPEKRFSFQPGQYMEWSLPHHYQDSRGIRRYFTLASAPSDELVRIAIRFHGAISTFKQHLLQLQIGEKVFAGSLDGDFVLPEDKSKRLVLIAGGIGITPFMSMVRELMIKKEKRNITFFYCRDEKDFPFLDVLGQAEAVGVKTVLVVKNGEQVEGFSSEAGFINEEMIKKYVPTLQNTMWYLSGPYAMVETYKDLIRHLGVSLFNIKTDYFPGY